MIVVAKFYCEGVKKHDTGGSEVLRSGVSKSNKRENGTV
jgi:hypothetical protein